MRLVADSFSWPFRGEWRSKWLIGLVVVILLPIGFIPLLGYAVAATRAAETDRSQGPPPWPRPGTLFRDGFWTALAIFVVTAPLVLIYLAVARSLSDLIARVVVAFGLALPWGCALLFLMPHATARFAATGRWKDLFDYVAIVRRVRTDFSRWNLVAAAIVTAWVAGLACAALLCVGVVPGIFYAILVSAHASAALNHENSPLSTG